MKVVIAIDSLKGSLSSMEAGNAIAQGIKRAVKDADIKVRPLADGGEGTAEALTFGMGGTEHQVEVTGPLGEAVSCTYGIVPQSKTAIIEIAGAAGITLLQEEQRNPLYTTTYGVGEVIKDAIGKGCRHFIIGIGGSATNDGGVGMLQALGFGFLDASKNQIPFGAKGLEALASITEENVMAEIRDCTFQIACDVTNPLCGPKGCSAIYGPQKGADAAMVRQMDQWLLHYANMAQKNYPTADPKQAGAGAAGGLGFAFMTFLKARLESGIQIVLEQTKLAAYIQEADIVVTGEGRLDGQTAMGKAPVGVAKLAKSYNKVVLAFAGSVTKEATLCNEQGIDAFFPILRSIVTLEEAMATENAKNNLRDTAEQVFRLLQVR